MAFACTTPVKPTMELLKLSGVQCSDGVRYAGWFADSVWVDCPDSEVVGVCLEQPRHWVFTNLYGVIIALGPVVSSNLTSTKCASKKTRKGVQECSRQHTKHNILYI